MVEKEASNPNGNVQQGTLKDLVRGFNERPGLLPWLKVPTGQGAAFFDITGILAVKQAFGF